MSPRLHSQAGHRGKPNNAAQLKAQLQEHVGLALRGRDENGDLGIREARAHGSLVGHGAYLGLNPKSHQRARGVKWRSNMIGFVS